MQLDQVRRHYVEGFIARWSVKLDFVWYDPLELVLIELCRDAQKTRTGLLVLADWIEDTPMKFGEYTCEVIVNTLRRMAGVTNADMFEDLAEV